MSRTPLEGVRVCDFGWVWAGPTCSTMLAYLGAEVIKIESYDRLDPTRATVRRAQEPPPPNQSLLFNSLNLNKKGITLNLRQPKGVALVKDIVGVCDAVLNNFAAGVMERLGLGYEDLCQVRPDVVLLSMSGFGATGPHRGYHGYASTFEALSGITDMSGYAGGPPTRSAAGAHMDIANGLTGAVAMLVALNHRKRTGEGQFVDLSEWELPNALVGEAFLDWAMNLRNPERHGNRDDIMAPHNCYPCRGEDKWVSIAVANDAEWQALCRAAGHPEWASDPRFPDAPSRRRRQEELDRMIGEWTRQYTHYEVMYILQRAGVAAMPSFSQAELVADPHIRARGALMEVEHGEAGTNVFPVPPWRLSETPAAVVRASPMIGEHNEHVFCELLGIPVEEFADLLGQQVIY